MSNKITEMSGDIRITGAINDEEFSAQGSASGNPSTGEYKVRLDYTNIPKGWHPFMYTDVKVSLLFLREEDGGTNFLNLTAGTYKSAGTIDLGDGNILRNNTNIKRTGSNTFVAVYVMNGTAHIDELVGMDYFEETMLPFGPGRIASLAIAQWKTKRKPVEALFSTRYLFEEKYRLDRAQFRRIEATPQFDGKSFTCTYKAFVKALPKVEEGGPYIGHLIS
jgi:hypothetical protein